MNAHSITRRYRFNSLYKHAARNSLNSRARYIYANSPILKLLCAADDGDCVAPYSCFGRPPRTNAL